MALESPLFPSSRSRDDLRSDYQAIMMKWISEIQSSAWRMKRSIKWSYGVVQKKIRAVQLGSWGSPERPSNWWVIVLENRAQEGACLRRRVNSQIPSHLHNGGGLTLPLPESSARRRC